MSRTRPAAFKPPPALIAGVIVAILLGFVLWRRAAGVRKTEPPPPYVGEGRCAPSHAAETEAWLKSHHAQAMQVANGASVPGDFSGARFTKDGVTSSFFKKDGKYYIHSDGPDGELQNFEAAYTFGVYPLQQYLIPFPRGRLQAFGVGWDSRPRERGGQRWFPLYPSQKITRTDALHWTVQQPIPSVPGWTPHPDEISRAPARPAAPPAR